MIEQGGRPEGGIKIRLDHRTVITVSSLKALEFWKTRYPKAHVIQ